MGLRRRSKTPWSMPITLLAALALACLQSRHCVETVPVSTAIVSTETSPSPTPTMQRRAQATHGLRWNLNSSSVVEQSSRPLSTASTGPPPPKPLVQQIPLPEDGCVSDHAANAAFNIIVQTVDQESFAWPHKNWTFEFNNNIIELFNTSVLPKSAELSGAHYLTIPAINGTDPSTRYQIDINYKASPTYQWYLCAPQDPQDWQAVLWMGRQQSFPYCRGNGFLYQTLPATMPNFARVHDCVPAQLYLDHQTQNVYNGYMVSSSGPGPRIRRDEPSRQVLEGAPKAPKGHFSDPRCHTEQWSPFRLVEVNLLEDLSFNWTSASLPTGGTLWTMQDGNLATVEQGATNLRLVIEEQDEQVQTTNNANWANIQWNTGWSLCGKLHQLAIGGSSVFADCGNEVRFNNVSWSGEGTTVNGDGVGPHCKKVVLLAVPAGLFGNPNARRGTPLTREGYMRLDETYIES